MRQSIVTFTTNLTVFATTYVVPPVLRKLGARILLPSCVFLYGVVTASQASINHWGELICIRAAIGVLGASFIPTIQYNLR